MACLRVCVIGLGKIGLQLALYYTKFGIKVIGLDTNESLVSDLNSGKSHLTAPGIPEVLENAINNHLFTATTDPESAITWANVIIVIVPVFYNAEFEPDFSIIDSVSENIGKFMQKGTVVSFESTLPVGTTKGRLKNILLLKSSNFTENDFYLGFSPERVSTNSVFDDLENKPKIISGIDKKSGEKLQELYRNLLPKSELILLENTDAAEFTKLMGMVYRDVNIALANQFSMFCDKSGLDVRKIIKASNSSPFSHVLQPGIGAGGHCLPVYPYFYMQNCRKYGVNHEIIKNARDLNFGMPKYCIRKLEEKFKTGLSGKKVLILGLAYREDIRETHLAPTLDIISELKKRKTEIYLDDPLFSKDEIEKFGVKYYDIFSDDGDFDIVILSTYHSKYGNIDFSKLKTEIFFDGRNKIDRNSLPRDTLYIGVGK